MKNSSPNFIMNRTAQPGVLLKFLTKDENLYYPYAASYRHCSTVCNMKEYRPDIDKWDDAEICRRIHRLTSGMINFWKNSHGWASMETPAGLGCMQSATLCTSSMTGRKPAAGDRLEETFALLPLQHSTCLRHVLLLQES